MAKIIDHYLRKSPLILIEIIFQIENCSIKIGKIYYLLNGYATLKLKIFFNNRKIDERNWRLSYGYNSLLPPLFTKGKYGYK